MDIYTFHQTPSALAAELMKHVPLTESDVVYEPFRGEGAFYNAIPTGLTRQWTEIAEGKDFREHTDTYDWVITNPPFKIDAWDKTPKNGNAFFPLLDYFTDRARKGVAFFGNDYCFSSLMTPKRFMHMRNKGWYIQKVITANVRKWRGRYYLIILTRDPCSTFATIEGNW
jgi:hypothetical protein